MNVLYNFAEMYNANIFLVFGWAVVFTLFLKFVSWRSHTVMTKYLIIHCY